MIRNLFESKRNYLSKNIKILDDCDDSRIGNKARNIRIINEKTDYLIPETLVVNTKVFSQLLVDNKISDPFKFNWSNFKIPTNYKNLILKKILKVFGDKSLVIRSSATCEDSPLLSFAGQYSSFLNIKGNKSIIDAIKLCYQSLFSDNAKIYAETNNIDLKNESMAIVIQELAPVVVSGIAFTADPINRDDRRMIFEYTQGLGDTIVSGHQKPELVDIEKKKVNNLKNIFLKEISIMALNLERVFNSTQNIEWGWDGRKIYIFQSRNITTLNKKTKIANIIFKRNKVIAMGIVACKGIEIGFLRVINNDKDYDKIKKGDVVLINCKVSNNLIRKIPIISALIVKGGILSHVAIIAREFNIPCLVEPTITSERIEEFKDKRIIVNAIKGKILKV